jgi:hypothetical protein
MITVIIIEDDEKIHDYLVAMLNASDNFKLISNFTNAEDAMIYFKSGMDSEVDIILTDIKLADKSGIDFIAWLKPLRPDIQFMVLTVYDNADTIFKALKFGATGYLLKNTEAPKLLYALTDLYNGGSPMSNEIARKIVNAFQQDLIFSDAKDKLSQRQNEVLVLLSKGYSYKEIAERLFISVETVRTHIRNIYEKLHARNKLDALRKAGLK